MSDYSSIIVKKPIATTSIDMDVSYYFDPIDTTTGRLAGNTRDWGDASESVQKQVIDKILAKAEEYNLSIHNTALLLATIRAESGFNPDAAAGSSSAVGLGQFTDKTRVDWALDTNSMFDVDANLDSAARYFLACKEKVEQRGLTGAQEDAMIYKYYHDGLYSDKTDSGGLANYYKNVQPYLLKSLGVAISGGSTSYDDFKDLIQASMDNLTSLSRSLFTTAIASRIPRGDPLAIDLDKDGVETTSVTDGSYFDHDANGFAEQTGWAASDDGLLALDRNGDGIINDGKELFGDQTILANGTKAANGFQALKELDANNDNKIDINDAAYTQLKIWQDVDGDGYSTADELHTLSDLGIKSINTGYTNSTLIDANGNEHKQIGSFTWNDNTTNAAEDIWFQTDKMYTIANEWVDVPEDIAALPDLQGYGNVYDLHQAMARERLAGTDTLKTLVDQFIAATDANTRNNLMNQIIYRWTGVDGIDPASRGTALDSRKLTALEKLFAATGPASLNLYFAPNTVSYINKSYNGVFELCYGQLMAQTHFKDLMSTISMTWNDETEQVEWDVSATPEALQSLYISNPDNAPLAMSEFADILKLAEDAGLKAIEDLRAQGDPAGDGFLQLLSAIGINTTIGNASSNTLQGTGSNDALYGMGGNDNLYGNAGNDILDGGSKEDELKELEFELMAA